MKGLPPALRKALKTASKMPSSALQKLYIERSGDKPHKYGAKRETCLYGHLHASRKEAMWCVKLHELQKEGKIKNLEIQRTFDLDVLMSHICKHIVDFYYEESFSGMTFYKVLEVKGLPTPEWKLKRKLFCSLYPYIKYEVV